MEVVLVAVVAFMFVLAWLYNNHKKSERRQLVHAASSDLFDEWKLDPDDPIVRGTLSGLDVCFRLTTRGSGSNSESWTECDVTMATDWFVLELKPEGRRERRQTAEGTMRDVQLGDEEFDASFVVEVAPAELAQRVFDVELRARLGELHPVAIEPIACGLRLAKKGWIEDQDRIRSFVQLAADVGRRIEDARDASRETQHRAAIEQAALTGYRGAQREDASAIESAAAEVNELREMRTERARRLKERNFAITAILVIAIIVGFIITTGRSC